MEDPNQDTLTIEHEVEFSRNSSIGKKRGIFSEKKDGSRTSKTVKNSLENPFHHRNRTTYQHNHNGVQKDKLEINNASTPDIKGSTQLSSPKEDRRDYDNFIFNGTDPSKTFISTSDHQQQMSIMEDRITKLENLVWTLYKEVNGRIDTTAATAQIQLEEISSQITQNLQTRKSEEGYDGSAEENNNATDTHIFEGE